jgi:hypothetical protein
MLMYADNGGVDHLDSRIMGSGDGINNALPHPGLPPAHETIVASGIGAECCGQITPGCAGSQDPENAIEDRQWFKLDRERVDV